MALPVLPQDVFDEIISQLDNDDASTLKSCSLVCRSFRRSAQKILFNSIVILVDGVLSRPTNLGLIVKTAPHLIEYVQGLNITGGSQYHPLNVDDSTDLADALGIFSRKGEFPINLRSLLLANLPWDDIPPRLQDALVPLTAVHSLRDINLEHLTHCPPNLVANLPPLLKSLSLSATIFSSLPTTRKELPRLESFKVGFLMRGLDQFPDDAMERMVNMTQLKTFRGGDCNPDSMPVIERILRPTYNSLEHLIFRFYIKDPDSISIDLNQFPRLTDITIDQFCNVRHTVSLIPPAVMLITGTMKKISHRNVIQNLSFRLSFGNSVGVVDVESAMKSVWQELDTVCFIPQLTSFRGMTFNIRSNRPANRDALSDLIRNGLPETKKANKLYIKTSRFRWVS